MLNGAATFVRMECIKCNAQTREAVRRSGVSVHATTQTPTRGATIADGTGKQNSYNDKTNTGKNQCYRGSEYS